MIPPTKTITSNRLGGQAAFFLVGNVFTLLIGLPLQIYVARMLGADGLGVFSLIEGGVGIAAGLIAFGLAPTLVKFIPVHLEQGEYHCIRKLIGRGVLVLLGAGVIVYILMLLALPIGIQYWPILAEHRTSVIVMGLLVPLGLIVFFLQQGLRGFQEIRYMVLGSSFMQLTVKAVLAVLLLAMGFHLIGYIWAVVVSVLCTVVWMSTGLWRKLSALPMSSDMDCSESKKAWRAYSTVMYSSSLVGLGAGYLDRFLLGLFAGASPVGVLMVVKQLQQMPVIFLQMFLAVAAPMFSAAHARGDVQERQHIYHLTTDWVVRLSAPLFIFFSLFAEPLLNLYGNGFAQQGIHAMWILLSAQAINLGYGPLGSVLNMSGMEGLMLRLTIYQTAIMVLGLLFFLPSMGLVGVALAISAGLVFLNVAAFHAARKILGLRWTDRRYLRWIAPLAASITTGILVLYFGPYSPGAMMLLGYLVLLYAVFHGVSIAQGLHEDDRELLGHLLAKLGLVKRVAT